MAYDGVIDPIPPSVDQCIQVVVDPNQEILRDHAYGGGSNVPKDAYLVPRNVIVLTAGATWSPNSGVKRSRVDRNSPVLPVIAGRDQKDPHVPDHKKQLRVAGVSIDGCQNSAAAKKSPDACGRMSVQMHGVATVFCAKALQKDEIKTAKFGDKVVVDIAAPAVQIRGITGTFYTFQTTVVPKLQKINPANQIFVGWLVDVGPSDRNELRVHLDQNYATFDVTTFGSFGDAVGSSFTDGIGATMTDAAPAASAVQLSAPGVAVAALSVPAADTAHGMPHGVVLATAGMSSSELRKAAIQAEWQESSTGMSAERAAALFGDGQETAETCARSAKVLSDFYNQRPQEHVSTAAVRVGGSLVPCASLTDDVIRLAASETGAPPASLLQQTCMDTGSAVTSMNAVVLPEHYDKAVWKAGVKKLMDDYRGSPAVSSMSDAELTTLLTSARNTLHQ